MTLKDIYKIYQEFTIEIGAGKLSRANFKADLLAIDGVQLFDYRHTICFNIIKNSHLNH